MLLQCECFNTTADALHGAGWRPHVKLVKHDTKPQEYMCAYCYWVRTRERGLRDGRKTLT